MTDPRRVVGQHGEDAAAAWYTAAGYEILDRNWRVREGDHDLVALTRSDLVIAAGTPVRLLGLIGLHVAHVDPRIVVGAGLGPVVFRHSTTTVSIRLRAPALDHAPTRREGPGLRSAPGYAA